MRKRGVVKGIVVSVAVVASIIIIGFMFLIFNSSSFLIEEHLLDSRQTEEGRIIEVIYLGGGATVNEVVQIRRMSGRDYEILGVFENYNQGRIGTLSDSSLTVILRYTMEGKPDTILVDLK